MPFDAGHGWQRADMVTADEVIGRLSEQYDIEPEGGQRGSAPAERFRVDGGPATVGVIAAVSAPFCAACDRIRLTADGQLRSCLFAVTETDLRSLLRNGADDRAIASVWRDAMWDKDFGHGIGSADFAQPARPMSAIGG
ncbi:hypothetical protein [Mycobacterium syngnathidarum]